MRSPKPGAPVPAPPRQLGSRATTATPHEEIDTAPAAPFGGRCYDVALAVAEWSPGMDPSSTGLPSGGEAPGGDAQLASPADVPLRPPPGAPVVRPPARRASRALPALDELLTNTADELLLVTEPDGSIAFDVSIRDDLFDELACRITLRDGRLSATFRVRDVNLRRLLLAEAGRLENLLAARGLRVTEIRVSDA